MDNLWFIAAFWMGLALLASLISIRLGISVALIEILVGVVVGNIHTAISSTMVGLLWTAFGVQVAFAYSGTLFVLGGLLVLRVSSATR